MKVNFANSNACAGNGGVLLLGYGLTFQKRRKGACLKTQANDLMHNKTEKPPRKMNMGPQMHKLCAQCRISYIYKILICALLTFIKLKLKTEPELSDPM